MENIKFLELFGGIGAPRKAGEKVFTTNKVYVKKIDYVEWWDQAVFAYDKLFNNGHKPQDVADWNLNVDILAHGSPCPRFSTATSSFYSNNDVLEFGKIYGKKETHDKKSYVEFFDKKGFHLSTEQINLFKKEFNNFFRTSGLYFETLDIIENRLTPRPKVVIWENVKGLVNKSSIQNLNHYLEQMEKFGYKNTYKVLNSKDFGIPQSRNRVFVISILESQTKFNNDFDFEKLETTPYAPLKNFLEPHDKIDKSYYITQKSMTTAIQQGKIKIVDDYVQTILTKQIRWNNQGVTKVPLHKKKFNSTDFVHNPEGAEIHTIGSNSANNRIAVPLVVEEEFNWKNGRTKIPTRNFGQYKEVVNDECGVIPTLTTNNGESPFKVAVPLKKGKVRVKIDFIKFFERFKNRSKIYEMAVKEFGNFITIPRGSDGELINGAHNRVWKTNTYIGTLAASTIIKILVPLKPLKTSNQKIDDINKEFLGSVVEDTNEYISISEETKGEAQKILVDAIEPIPNVPIFIIDGKPYHLRVLTQREAWRLMGWEDNDIDKIIDMPKTHLYKMAGNSIVVQVLEAIFKELIRGK